MTEEVESRTYPANHATEANMLAMTSKRVGHYHGARTLQSLGEGEQPLLQRQGWVGSGRHIVDVVAAVCRIWRGGEELYEKLGDNLVLKRIREAIQSAAAGGRVSKGWRTKKVGEERG